MANINDKALEVLQETMKNMISSPGRGAERACAVITALGASGAPMDRVTEVSIKWTWMDEEVFPDIKIKFDDKSFNTKG